VKPSDFPRDERFYTPGPAFIEDGVAHLRSYRDVKRAMLDRSGIEFTQDVSYWAPADQRLHINWYFLWATGTRRKDGAPGRHATLRGLVEPWFRTRVIETFAPIVWQLVETLVRAIVQKGTGKFDLATEFAYPLALRTICALTGLPMEREQWIRRQLGAFAQTPTMAQLGREPQEVEDYLWEVVHERSAHPRDQLVDLIIAAWQQNKITDLEVLGYIWGFFIAGGETIAPHVVNIFSLLAEFDLLDCARARVNDEAWLDTAGEEVLRFATPFSAGPLLAVSDVLLDDGVKIPAMTPVQGWFSAANRDEAINGGKTHAASPMIFDPGRSPNLHLGFGTGMHHCIGAPLARLAARMALKAALPNLPELELDSSRPFERYAGIIDGVNAAPFQFNQQKAEHP
jgi:cytochrome P450